MLNKDISKSLIGILSLLLFHCTHKKEQHDDYNVGTGKIRVWAISNDSLIYVRLQNISHNSYYVPARLTIQLPDSEDTAYFSGVNKSKISVKSYYYYSKFSDPIVTNKKLTNLPYDSVETTKTEANYFQFQPPSLIELKPGDVRKYKISFPLSRNTQFGAFRIYKIKYIEPSDGNYEEYHSFENFIRFEDTNTFFVFSKILPAIVNSKRH